MRALLIAAVLAGCGRPLAANTLESCPPVVALRDCDGGSGYHNSLVACVGDGGTVRLSINGQQCWSTSAVVDTCVPRERAATCKDESVFVNAVILVPSCDMCP